MRPITLFLKNKNQDEQHAKKKSSTTHALAKWASLPCPAAPDLIFFLENKFFSFI